MSVLNNIWLALSTPNEILTNVGTSFLIFLVEAPLSLYLILNLFDIKATKKQSILYITVFSVISILSKFIIESPFNVILNYVAGFLIFYFIFKLNLLKTVIASLFPSIIFSLLGVLITNPYLSLLNISNDELISIPIYRFPPVIFMYLIAFIIAYCLKHKNFKIDILDNLDKKNKYIIMSNFLFGVIYIIIQMFLTFNYADVLPLAYTFFNFICLLTYFGLSFYTLNRIIKLFTTTQKLVTTTQKLESAEEYNKTLHILHDSVRGFKHDFDNIVTTIGGYVKTKDMEGLEKYYSQLQEDCSKVNNLYVLNPDIINNPGIYNLLTTKYNEAEEKGIKVNLTFLLDLNNLNMKIYEFARILGILLDNAIDAASECDKKIINISFRNDSRNNRNIVLIENTYNDKNVDLDNIFKKGVTGKANHTGLGLWEIRQIINKNNNINLYTTKDKQYFSQQLEIYY